MCMYAHAGVRACMYIFCSTHLLAEFEGLLPNCKHPTYDLSLNLEFKHNLTHNPIPTPTPDAVPAAPPPTHI